MNTLTKCLFGGALLGAGLSSSAVAGEFVWGFSYATVQGGYVTNSHIGTGNFDVSAASYFGSANVTADGDGLSMSAFATDYATYSRGGATSFADLNAGFMVTEDMSVTIEWNFDSYSYAYVNFDGMGLTGSGSFNVDFTAGTLYDIYGFISASPVFALNGGESTFSITENSVNVVPLPPAAFGGLAMLAGLGAFRRIRK